MLPTIRLATAENVATIARIVHDAYNKYVTRIGQLPGPRLEDYAAQVAANLVHVCQDDTGIAGVIVLEPQPDHLLLDNVAVAPAWQGQGIGRLLLEFADAEARRRGFSELRLYTHALMHENQALYSRLGWREYAREEQDGFQHVFMRKRL